MTEPTQTAPQPSPSEIPEELALEIRKLAHDLSNALEIIVQTNYLLGTVELKEPGSEWLLMLDNGVRKALNINLALRATSRRTRPGRESHAYGLAVLATRFEALAIRFASCRFAGRCSCGSFFCRRFCDAVARHCFGNRRTQAVQR